MREARLRLTSIITGLIFSVFFSAFTPYNNIKLQNSPLAGGHFPLASFGCLLFLIVILNPVLSSFRKSWRFDFHELLLIWSMVAVATGIAYTGLMRTFVINITTPEWFASTTSDLAQILSPLSPSSLFPQNPQLIKTLYEGIEGGLDMNWWQILVRIPWKAWIAPIVWWGVFIFFVYMAMVGLAGVFSHQWIEIEKMNFPLLQVPQIISEGGEKGTIWRYFAHRYFLIGFAIPFFLHLLNGLHAYYPEFPEIPTIILAQPYIPRQGLFSGFYKMRIYVYPAFIGFAYLTSKQISFSLWIFFLLGGLLPGFLETLGWRIPAAAIGTTFGPGISRVEEMQMTGAFAVFFFFIVWLARTHVLSVIMSVFHRKKAEEDFHGFLPPKQALLLFLCGFAGVAVWLLFFGMNLVSAIAFLGVSFMIQLVASRLICQGGLPYFTLAIAPSDGFLALMNSRLIAPATLYIGLVVQKVTFLDMRESLTPSLFLSSKLSDHSHPRRRFFCGIVLAIVAGLVVSFVAMLALYYKFGIRTLPDDWALETTRRVYENAAQLLTHPEEAKAWSRVFALIGAGVMVLLIVGYHRFVWWPLHPIGYLTTYNSAMQILWFSFFLGWLCNAVVLRYGGVTLFKEVRRLFVGLIVGDMFMAIVWLIVGIFAPFSYHVLPL